MSSRRRRTWGSDHDRLFYRFMLGVFILLLLYGAGMTAVVIFGEVVLASRMVSGFATMFAATLGLGSGYLLGRGDK